MDIWAEDSYPEEKTHNQAKYTYAPYLVVPRPAEIVKCGGCGILMLLCLKVERALKCQLPSLSTAFHRHKDRSENGAVGNCDMAGIAARWRSSAAGSSLDTMLGIRVLCLLSFTCVPWYSLRCLNRLEFLS